MFSPKQTDRQTDSRGVKESGTEFLFEKEMFSQAKFNVMAAREREREEVEEYGKVNHDAAVRRNNILRFFKSGGCGRSSARQQYSEKDASFQLPLPPSTTSRDRKDSWPACLCRA